LPAAVIDALRAGDVDLNDPIVTAQRCGRRHRKGQRSRSSRQRRHYLRPLSLDG
jgi:hypothetical protein